MLERSWTLTNNAQLKFREIELSYVQSVLVMTIIQVPFQSINELKQLTFSQEVTGLKGLLRRVKVFAHLVAYQDGNPVPFLKSTKEAIPSSDLQNKLLPE
jgi:hypothetical protein